MPSLALLPRDESAVTPPPVAAEDAALRRFDRRRRRSEDPITALHYQLASARTAAQLEALVLVDEGGCLLAGAGSWPLCEELAAYAPLLASAAAAEHATRGSRLAALAREVLVRTLSLDGVEAVLCGRGGGGGEARVASIARAAAGCRRILGAEA